MSDASFQRRRISTLLLTDDLAGFIVAGFALTGSPGPATLSLAGTAAAFGVRKGVPLAAGCIAGVVLVMLVTASGLAGLVLAQPFLGPVVRGLAGAYMLYLAWRIATAPPIGAANRAGRAPSLLADILLNIGNPKAYAAMAALFSGFTLAGLNRPPARSSSSRHWHVETSHAGSGTSHASRRPPPAPVNGCPSTRRPARRTG